MFYSKIKLFVLKKINDNIDEFINRQPIHITQYLEFIFIDENTEVKHIDNTESSFFIIIDFKTKIDKLFVNHFSFIHNFLSLSSEFKTASFLPVINDIENYKVIIPNPYLIEMNISKSFMTAFNKNYKLNDAIKIFYDWSNSYNTYVFFPYLASIKNNNNIYSLILNQQNKINELIDRNTIYVKFISQLGNNFFQLFTAQKMAIEKNKFVVIIVNNIRKDIFQLYHYKPYSSLKKNIKIIYNNKNSIKNKKDYYKPVNVPKEKCFMLNGYFQNIKNFTDKNIHLSPLKGNFDYLYNQDFCQYTNKINTYLNNENDKKEKGEIIGIHIRLGDYVKQQHTFYVYTLKHVIKQIDFIIKNENLNSTNLKILLFTNDANTLNDEIVSFKKKKQFNFSHEIVDLNDIFSLILMSKLKYLIIPNSTFSWFGAYMSNNLKLGIMANDWLKDGRTGNPGPPHINVITKTFII